MGTKKVVCNPNPNLIGIITITSGAWEQYAGQAKFLTASNWTIPANGAVYIKGTAFINHFYSNTITVSGILSLESNATSTFASPTTSMNVRDINVSGPSGVFFINSGEVIMNKIRFRSFAGISNGGKISINGGKLTLDYIGAVTSPGHITLGATSGNTFEMTSGIVHIKKSNPSSGAYAQVIDFALGSLLNITGGMFILGDGIATGGVLSNGFKVINLSNSAFNKFAKLELRLNTYTLNMQSDFAVSDSLILTSGTVNPANHNFQVNGIIANNNVTFPTTMRMEIGGDKTYTLPNKIFTLKSLRINKTGGEAFSSNSLIIDSLFLINGKLNSNTFGFRINDLVDANLGILSGTLNFNSIRAHKLPPIIRTTNPNGLTGSANSTFGNTFVNFKLPSTGLVEYYGIGSQFISSRDDYNNVNVFGGGTKTLLGNVTINGKLDLINADLAIESNILTLKGIKSGLGSLVGSRQSSIILNKSGDMGSLEFSTQHIDGNYLKDLLIDLPDLSNPSGSELGKVTLGNNLNIAGTLTLKDGELKTANKLTLISDQFGTARVDSIINGTIIDSIIAQRYVPAIARRYRMLSSPVQTFFGSTSGVAVSQMIDDIHITGTGGIANGFDPSNNNNSSSLFYNEPVAGYFDFGYSGPSSTSQIIPTGAGILVLLRGNRNSPTLSGNKYFQQPFPAQTAVTLDYTGIMNQGNISPSLTYTVSPTPMPESDGYNLVGNPFPSQIDWKSPNWIRNNIDRVLYIFNPATNSYGTYLSNSPFDNGTNGVGRYIASGQAFFVKANGPNPNLTFTESLKSSGAANTVLRNGYSTEAMRIKMELDSVNSDELLVIVDSTSNLDYNSNEDGLKFLNAGFNLYSKTISGKLLSISTVPSLAIFDTVFLSITSTTNRTYKFIFNDLQSIDESLDILLIDNFLGTSSNLRSNNMITFSTNSDPNSKGDSRFKVIFQPSIPLPIKITSFTGKVVDQNSVLQWKTSTEINTQEFLIQQSSNAKEFITIGNVKAKGGINISTNYTFINKDHFSGINYYRLISKDLNGRQDTSKIIALKISSNSKMMAIRIYPNPADEVVNISILGSKVGSLLFTISTIDGKLIRNKNVSMEENETLIKENIADLPEGTYLFLFKDTYSGENLVSLKVIKN